MGVEKKEKQSLNLNVPEEKLHLKILEITQVPVLFGKRRLNGLKHW